MTPHVALPDPFDVVSKALQCRKQSLSEHSAMYLTHRWDSFGHVSIIAAIEQVLEVNIDNDDVMKMTTMKAICDFFTHHSHTTEE